MQKARITLAGVIALVLSGCAPSDHLFVTNKVFNMGFDELPADMVGRNMVGTIAFDEGHPSKLNRQSQSTLYVHGVKEGTPEYGMRIARVNLLYPKGAFWYGDGTFLWQTAGAVADQFPRMRAGDVVELRHVATYRTLVDFSATGEGNIVTRVLCRKADPAFDKCLEGVPRAGKHAAPAGTTGTDYPASAKAYGFTFTPAYDSKGQPLRPIPEFKPS